jgi:membrane-bound lytic murein transglycosylase D
MERVDRYDSLFRYYGHKHEIPWTWLKAQGIAESLLEPKARSPVGAVGVMQFMPKTWQEWWDETIGIQGTPGASRTNPEVSIAAAAAYMAKLHEVFLVADIALAAYNWGWGNVRRFIRKHGYFPEEKLPRETRQYIKRINEIHERLLREL